MFPPWGFQHQEETSKERPSVYRTRMFVLNWIVFAPCDMSKGLSPLKSRAGIGIMWSWKQNCIILAQSIMGVAQCIMGDVGCSSVLWGSCLFQCSMGDLEWSSVLWGCQLVQCILWIKHFWRVFCMRWLFLFTSLQVPVRLGVDELWEISTKTYIFSHIALIESISLW